MTGQPHKSRAARSAVHEVRFITFPKLLFVWPVIVAGLAFWPLGFPAATQPAATTQATDAAAAADGADTAVVEVPPVTHSPRLAWLGWVYIWLIVVVLMTLGVDVDRNQFVFWIIFVAAFWLLGAWLKDVRGITFFGDIYAWFASLNVQYDRSLGLALSLILLVPYVLMLAWARINDSWRITHNEFEHYSLGKMDDSLGRGAKTIRTSFPDILELLLGLAGTLVVYNATGTKELRRIPHVPFLPFVRARLNKILERTAITGMIAADEEEDDDEES